MVEIFLIFILAIMFIVALVAAFGWKNIHYRVLNRDMAKWQREGWVSASGAQAILDDKRPAGLGGRLVFLVGLLGAILLLFAAISFVAANWENMSRLSRLTWLLAVLWLSFLAGWRLMANNHPRLAEIAWLLGIGLFGVNITLIAQMFHIDSHPPNGVLMWTIGALASAALLRSQAALALTFGGAITWSLMEVIGYNVLIHWQFLMIWLPAFALTMWSGWKFAHHLAFLSLLTWTILSLIRYAIEGKWAPHGVIVIFIMGFLLLLAVAFVLQANRSQSEGAGFEYWLERYAIIGLLPAVFALQTIPFKLAKKIYGTETLAQQSDYLALFSGHNSWVPFALAFALASLVLFALTWREKLLHHYYMIIFKKIMLRTLAFALVSMPTPFFSETGLITNQTHDFLSTWIYGAAFLAMLIWLIEFGHRRGSDLYVWVALLTFAAEVLYVYFRIFGSLLETSLFFLVGGLLTMGLAFFLYRLHNRLEGPDEPPAVSQNSEVA